jgi:hypothetical protein
MSGYLLVARGAAVDVELVPLAELRKECGA